MPRYHFDQTINGKEITDLEGSELESREEARRVADEAVHSLLLDRDREADLECRCSVREADGEVVYRTSLFIPAFTMEEQELLAEQQVRRAAARVARLARLQSKQS